MHLKRFYEGQARAPHSAPPSGLSFDRPELSLLPCAQCQAAPTACDRETVNCQGQRAKKRAEKAKLDKDGLVVEPAVQFKGHSCGCNATPKSTVGGPHWKTDSKPSVFGEAYVHQARDDASIV